ncbi:hypothetical protein C8R44DRAFT_886228 [Mycena epipterygia]|nr:hypothetical protein C8R44DRAFT_886228 [Mycena epipterygia]
MGGRSENVWSNKDLETVFSVCTRVEHLLLINDLVKPLLLQMLAATDMRPKSVFLMVDLLHPQLEFAHPFFRNISHLAVADISRPQPGDPMHENWHHWPMIFRLPALTHLALGHSASPSLVQAIFTGAPHLEVLLISSMDARTAALFSEKLVSHDLRLVLARFGYIEELKLYSGIPSLDEVWTRADQFVSRKRSGQIPASDYYLESVPEANVQGESDSGSSPILKDDVQVESGSGRDSPLPETNLPADMGPEVRALEAAGEPEVRVYEAGESHVWLLDLDDSTHVELPTSGDVEQEFPMKTDDRGQQT